MDLVLVEPGSLTLTYENVASAPRVTRKVTRTVRRVRVGQVFRLYLFAAPATRRNIEAPMLLEQRCNKGMALNWDRIYRATVVILLALILAQQAGFMDLRHDSARAWREVFSPPARPEEEPAPATPGQRGNGYFGSAYEEDVLRAMGAAPASAPPSGFAGGPKK